MKKVFISTDIEGISGISTWDETEKGHADYWPFQKIMTNEVKAMCEALPKEVKEITVRDAHDSAKNIIHAELPQNVSMIYGFNGHIDQMMFGLDKSYDFAMLHGYHAAAGSGGGPLAHTECLKILKMSINGQLAGEVTLSIYTALMYGLPVCYIVGDKYAVAEAKNLNNNIIGTVTKDCEGSSIVSKHPDMVVEEIAADVKKVAKLYKDNPAACLFALPQEFKLEVAYKEHTDAYQASFYPGAKLYDANIVRFEHKDFIEVLRFVSFCM